MSDEKNDDFDECISDILQKPSQPVQKPPRYTSKYCEKISSYKNKKEYGVIGVPKLEMREPKQFLKKGEGVKKPFMKGHRECFTEPLPKTPLRATTGIKRKEKSTNFIKKNMKMAQASEVKSFQKFLVDSPNGHKLTYINSKYLWKSNYGSMPKYLIKRTQDIKHAEDQYKDELENKKHLCRMLSKDEIQEMLMGLKENWTRIRSYFMKLPLFIDTFSLINKKRKIEDNLKELEKHINFLEENPYIYVYDDD